MVMDKQRTEIMGAYRKYLRTGDHDIEESEKQLLGLSDEVASSHRYIAKETDQGPGVGNVGAMEILYQLAKFIKKQHPREWDNLVD